MTLSSAILDGLGDAPFDPLPGPWAPGPVRAPSRIHRPASPGCCWWSVQDTTLAQLKEKSQTRPLGARRLPFCFLKTRTLSFWTMKGSGVTSTWASIIGLSGDFHSPAGARFFAAEEWRSGEFCVAIGSQIDRLKASLAAHRPPRGDLIYYRTEVRRLQAAHLDDAPSGLFSPLEAQRF